MRCTRSPAQRVVLEWKICRPDCSGSVIAAVMPLNWFAASENRFDQARPVEIDWVDRTGTPLMHRQTVRISEDAVFIPEGGLSLTTAQQEVIERVARQTVSQMQTPW